MLRARTRTRFGGLKWFNSSSLKADGISPTLALDFNNARFSSNGSSRSFTNILSYARNSTATYVGSDGLIKTAGVSSLRYAYDPETLLFKGAMFEPQSTNVLINSSNYSSGGWARTDITVNATYGTAPDGTTTSNLITEGSAGTALLNQSATITASSKNTFSIFLKYDTCQWVRVFFYETANSVNQVRVWVDVLNRVLGTVQSSAPATEGAARIKLYPNGWMRVSITGVLSTATGISASIASATADANTTKVSNSTYQVWGAQFEAKRFMTSYIPTASTSVTRSADACNAPMTNFQNRTTTGTYKSYDGSLKTANIDEVRYNYSAPFPSANATRLIESSVTNNASSTYGATNMTYTAASATGPDNVANSAGTATTDAALNNHFIGNSLLPLVTIGQYYCVSAFVKYASGSQYVQLAATASAADLNFYVNYDISTGVQTYAGSAVVASGIEVYRDNWYRIWGVFQAIGGGGGTACVVASIPASGSSRLASFTGTNSFYIYGMQHELGSAPTSYIPTAASPASRTDDITPEPSTNLLRVVSQLTNTAWFKNGCTPTDAQLDPYGTYNACLITDSAAVDSYFLQTYTTTEHANKTYTFSIWVKSGTKPGNINIQIKDGVSTLVSQPITPTASWVRYSVTGTFGSAPAANIQVVVNPVDTTTAGDYYIFGPQLEERSTPTQLLIVPDNSSYKVPGGYNWYNTQAGTMFINMEYEGGDGAQYPMVFRFDDTTSNNRINIYFTAASNQFGSDARKDNIGSFGYSSPKDVSRVDTVKYAQAYRTNSARAADEGVLLGTEFTASHPVPMLWITHMCDTPTDLTCYVKEVRYYPLRISTPELQRIST